MKNGKGIIDMIRRILFRITYSLKVEKVNGKYVICIKKWFNQEWLQIVPNRYLSKTNALHDMEVIKKRGFV